jgi:RimJ/RimL family protein N-acetyltransferase
MQIAWSTPGGELSALEPSLADVATHAAELARAYNDPHNAPLLGHVDPFDAEEVVEHYEDMRSDGARSFLLFADGALAGDGDLRGLRDGNAEFAFLIAAPGSQGKGLGTRFALMLHAFAFRHLGLHHVYASIVPANVASRRVFDKLGYVLDEGATARSYADDPGDLTLSLDRDTFERLHGEAAAGIRISPITS